MHVTNFVTKTFLYDPKNYLADSENYLAENKNYLAESSTLKCRANEGRDELVRSLPSAAEIALNVHHARVQNKMFVESRSTIQGNGQLYSGNSIKMVNLFQDKTQPFINERFAPQTIQQYLFNKQIDKRNPEGLKGFSGQKNAYREGDICLVFCVNNKTICSLAPSKTGVRYSWRAET